MESEVLEDIIDERSKSLRWIIWIFLLAFIPGITNAMHLGAITFLTGNPKVWCHIPVLQNAKWTNEQIRNVSVIELDKKENCWRYEWDYENFKEIGYEEAMKFIKGNKKPSKVKCEKYQYEEEKPSIVSEWDLVCDKLIYRSLAQVNVSLGKTFGAIISGLLADKFGRKKCFIAGCFLYIFITPIMGFTKNLNVFLVIRHVSGLAGGAVYVTGFTIITELTVRKVRTRVGMLYNTSYAIGFMLLPLFAYYSIDWRHLVHFLTFHTVILLFNCWFIPESPRWLYTQGRTEDVIIALYGKKRSKDIQHSLTSRHEEPQQTIWKKFLTTGLKFWELITILEMAKRILIGYYTWFGAGMSYYAIALNSINFGLNAYYYLAFSGFVEMISYLIPLVMLQYMGRKITSVILYIIAGISLNFIIMLTNGVAIMVTALIGRFCIAAVFAVIILHIAELFPTSNRNSATGSCTMMAQLGGATAPLVVDFLGHIAWFIPSTLCGIVAISSALLILMLPETRNKPLLDLLEDVNNSGPKDRVSIRNCCSLT